MATVNEIKKKLRGYKYADMAASDMATVINNFRSLRIQDMKQFVHPKGKRENCVSVLGTLPVLIKEQTYNIPIVLWIHPKHPHECPTVYVIPTGQMNLQPSQYVDTNGRVYLPYLSFWKAGTSDLSALCQIMCGTFADCCPVYSRLPTSPRMLSPQSSVTTVAAKNDAIDLFVITDIAFLSIKDKLQPGYTLIDSTTEGKKANFVEGRLNRYMCYSKQQLSKIQGYRVVTGLMVLSVSERVPQGFQLVNSTRDSDAQVFKKKQLSIRLDSQEEAKEAITDIVLLRAHSKGGVQNGFTQLPEIGGLHICFKTTALVKPISRSRSKQLLSSGKEEPSLKGAAIPVPSPMHSMGPQSPAVNSPYFKSFSDLEIKSLKEKNSQLQLQLDMATKLISELQLERSQVRPDAEEAAYAEVRYVNVQRSVQFGVNDALWKVKRNDVKIIREIGRGASGLVSKGFFRGQDVAVKQIHQCILPQQHVMDEFKREVRIMASIQHPNLVRFIGAVFDESVENFTATPLLLLELLQTNLRRAYENSDLGFIVALSIFRDVAYGLHYLHEHQEPIIHRDVSAPNILLEALPGGMWRAKLSDFGSANFLKRSKTPGVGAIVYTAPEMFPRQDPTSPMPRATVKCDVFSYGIVLVEVITRSMPSVENRHRLFQEVQRKWHAMHDLTIQCTQAEPSDRPTMSSILNTLHHVNIPI